MVRLLNIALVFALLLLVGCSSKPSETVSEKVSIAFKAYKADNIDGALTILHNIPVMNDFDKAYVQRFIGVMYATKGDNNKAIDALKIATETGVLKKAAQGESLNLLADLQYKTKAYKDAIVTYQQWMDITGKEDAATFVKIGAAYTELNQQSKVITSANQAIKAYGDKQLPDPYILKINAHFELNQYKGVFEVVKTALKLFPENKHFNNIAAQFTRLPVKPNSNVNHSTPIVRIEPQYPRHAVKRRIEGWVQLSFDVDKAGKPTNIKVVKAQPRQVFDKSAIKALSRWIYHPKMKNGVPIIRKGLSVQLDYNFSK